jgi:hypothetical protein
MTELVHPIEMKIGYDKFPEKEKKKKIFRGPRVWAITIVRPSVCLSEKIGFTFQGPGNYFLGPYNPTLSLSVYDKK